MKFIFKEPKTYYRKFDLFQNSWIDLFLDQTEEEIIKSMHPYLGNKEYDYIGKDEKEIEKNLKDLYGYVISSNLYKKNNLFN